MVAKKMLSLQALFLEIDVLGLIEIDPTTTNIFSALIKGKRSMEALPCGGTNKTFQYLLEYFRRQAGVQLVSQ